MTSADPRAPKRLGDAGALVLQQALQDMASSSPRAARSASTFPGGRRRGLQFRLPDRRIAGGGLGETAADGAGDIRGRAEPCRVAPWWRPRRGCRAAAAAACVRGSVQIAVT